MKNLLYIFILIGEFVFISCANHSNKAEENYSIEKSEELLD